MVPPDIIGFTTRTVSGVTFNWKNGDAEGTNDMVDHYELYWTWTKYLPDSEETITGGSANVVANTTNNYLKECSDVEMATGTPITLRVKVCPKDGQIFEGNLL